MFWSGASSGGILALAILYILNGYDVDGQATFAIDQTYNATSKAEVQKTNASASNEHQGARAFTEDQNSTFTFPERMDCEQRLLAEAYTCVTKHGIDFNQFLLMAVSTINEDANVTKPAITDGVNMTEFREQVCKVRDSIMTCTFNAAKTLIDAQACANSAQPGQGSDATDDLLLNDQRYLVKEQMEAILGQYDVFCAEPCRETLLDDMKACYEKFELDPAIFLPTKSSGPVIGSDSWEVDTFCKNRNSLVSCLKTTRDSCPQSDQVLSAISLDLDTMAKGFEVLCSETDVYLKGLDCFETHSHQVGVCHSVKYRGVIRAAQRATELKWSQDKYFNEVCGVIVRHIECDMNAWVERKDEKCNGKILALKRKLHCSLVHEQCEKSYSD
ncbi:unnamed protein product, partial [Lymnaea stagnalis]